jgi:hypothetical protein
MREDLRQLAEICRQAGHVEFCQRGERPLERGFIRTRRVRTADELGEHGIELRRRRIAEIATRIDTNAGARGLLVGREGAHSARDDARLYCKSAGFWDGGLIRQAEFCQRGPGGDAKLRLDEIDAGYFLSDRVFDLNAWIALDEIVLAVLRVDEKFDRPCVYIFSGTREPDRVVAHALSQHGIELRCRRDLDDLLVPDLNRAIAFVQVDDVAVTIGQNLYFDVPRS